MLLPSLLRFALLAALLLLSAGADVTTREPMAPPPISKIRGKKAFEHLRLKVEITDDGNFLVAEKQVSLAKVTRLSRETRLVDPNAKLHIIATPETKVLDIKKLTKAAAEGGITDVLFSAYPKKPAKE